MRKLERRIDRFRAPDYVYPEYSYRPWQELATLLADEPRFVLLGLSAPLRLLLVVHIYREDDEVIRLISARKATRSERAQYGARWLR